MAYKPAINVVAFSCSTTVVAFAVGGVGGHDELRAGAGRYPYIRKAAYVKNPRELTMIMICVRDDGDY